MTIAERLRRTTGHTARMLLQDAAAIHGAQMSIDYHFENNLRIAEQMDRELSHDTDQPDIVSAS